jgi:hypothetical protein
MQTKRKLPIGIQTFSEIIRDGHYYVDKTPAIARLVDDGKYYFLSRPRRFGKSLLLDTIKELFEGNQALFAGLYIEDKWNWQKKYPVIRINFSDGVLRNRQELDAQIQQQLIENRERLGVEANRALDIASNFRSLLMDAEKKHGAKAVLLIDEYDKPILDNITEPAIAVEMREGLKNLYSVIKGADPFIKFCILTGVSKFTKVSLFSGLNNLIDITLAREFSAICGYTDSDLDSVFSAELSGLDRNEIRRWYNGYNWGGESVYNPFDALLLFKWREFKPYWFETATPTFLVNLLKERGVFTPDLTSYSTSIELLGHFDVGAMSTEALLFQTGYLTIKTVEEIVLGKWLYTLSYPNLEVKTSLNDALLASMGVKASDAVVVGSKIIKALRNVDFAHIQTHLKSLYASIPHDWYRKNPIANYEGHYASIFYSHFAALGVDTTVEDANANGKVDLTVQFNNTIFLFEFKVVEDKPTGEALQQLKEKNYAEKYKSQQQPIYLLGVEFSKTQKQIVGFQVEAI